METENAIVDSIHIFADSDFKVKSKIKQSKIYVVQNNNNNQFFYQVRNDEEFIINRKYTFINHCEKSFELIHPSILNISGFSIEKPYIYYNYNQNYHIIDEVELKDGNIQGIFYGIASGLSYLLSKGFYYENFSISSIFFNTKEQPKLFDYIDFQQYSENSEKKLISKYADVLTSIIQKKKKENRELKIDPELQNLLERCKQETNFPNFADFIKFFETTYYCTNTDIKNKELFIEYVSIFNHVDRLIFNKTIIANDIADEVYNNFIFNTQPNSILFYFNSLPEYDIKSLTNFFALLSVKFKKYLYYEDISLIFPDLKKFSQFSIDKNPFAFYKELMKKIKILEDQRNEKINNTNEIKTIETKIDALRIQAIHYLKTAYKNSDDVKIKIELALQYINGSILPYNLNKSLNILNRIEEADKSTQKLIDQMKNKIKATIQSTNIKKILPTLLPKQKEILELACEKEDIASMLYCGFAFYTGFNGFPINRVLSIEFYRKASKKSSHAMALLGELYFKGIIFPQNFKRAKKCFQLAADGGSTKAEIIYNLIGKHLWRSYLVEYNIDDIFRHYLPSFVSEIPNDSLYFSKINYMLDNNNNNILLTLKLQKLRETQKNCLYHSEKEDKNYSMVFKFNKESRNDQSFQITRPLYSQKILLSSKNIENTTDIKEQMKIAKNYYYGINGYPVNYSKAAQFFKLAADNNDFKVNKDDLENDNYQTEAQWRYAMMCMNYLGVNNLNDNELYLQKSAKGNNIRGKLLYALYLRNRGDIFAFEKLIKECCESENADAMYYYALHLEKVDKSLDQSMLYYQKAADKGNIDAIVRLIYIIKHRLKKDRQEYYEKKMKIGDDSVEQKKLEKNYKTKTEIYDLYLNYSVVTLNESLIIRLIHFYNKNKQYDQSYILIQMGIRMNYQLFNAYYADYLLNKKQPKDANDEKRAEKFALLAWIEKYPSEYMERYIYIMLEIYMRRNQHHEAVEFLLTNKSSITEKFRTKYLLFYSKLDKTAAKNYFITIDFCNEDYQTCHDFLMELKKNQNINIVKVFSDIHESATFYNNPFSMAVLGKIYKEGKYVIRSLKSAIQFFALSAKAKCPLGYYYLGKEYFYGRFMKQNLDKAKKYLSLAFKNHGEPKAGYFLYKIAEIHNEITAFDIKVLKESAFFGFKRALFKYGKYLLNEKGKKNSENNEKEEGEKLIIQSARQNYKKAKLYCKLHRINYEGGLTKYSKILNDNQNFDVSLSEVSNSIETTQNQKEANKTIINDEIISDIEDEKNLDLSSFQIDSNTSKKKSDVEKIPNLNSIVKDDKDFDSSLDEDDDISDIIAFWY